MVGKFLADVSFSDRKKPRPAYFSPPRSSTVPVPLALPATPNLLQETMIVVVGKLLANLLLEPHRLMEAEALGLEHQCC